MTSALQSVALSVQDGALGARSPRTANRALVMGCSSGGTVAVGVPVLVASIAALVAAAGYGTGVEAGAHILQETGAPIVWCRLTGTTAGAVGTVDDSGITGTSAFDVTGTPYDTYEGRFEVLVGGTIGTAGIKFRYSLDAGRTWEGTVSLGTATSYVIPNSGLTLTFGAGTLVAGDTASWPTTEPKWAAADATAGYTAVHAGGESLKYGFALVVGKATASETGTIDASMTAAQTAYRYVSSLVSTRGYNSGESDSTWQASVKADFASTTTTRVGACAGHVVITSPISGREYLRPGAWAAAARGVVNRVSEDLAKVKNGPLPRVKIHDSAGNLISGCRDEYVSPGMNDERFITFRTYPGLRGVYISNPHLLAGAGSDFDLWQYRRVMDVACGATYAQLALELGNDVRLNRTTGFILEREALGIEQRVNSALRAALLETGDASNAYFVASRTDNLSSTKTFTGEVRILPLGYMKAIVVPIGFENPALVTTTG